MQGLELLIVLGNDLYMTDQSYGRRNMKCSKPTSQWVNYGNFEIYVLRGFSLEKLK